MATPNMQIPQAMQLLAPDIAQEQMQLSRRQQIADLLRKQSLEPAGGTETIGGWAIKKSPFEALGKMAQALSANYVQDKTDARQLELAKALQERMGPMFGAGTTSPDAAASSAQTLGSMQQPSQPDASGEMVNQGGIGPTNANAGRMATILAQGSGAAPQGGGMTIPGMTPKQAQQIFMMDPSAYMGAYLKQYDPTEMQKNDRYLGISAPDSKASLIAERLVKGTQTLAPNTTGIMPDGSKIVGADFANGSQGGYDLQGNATAKEIPNAAIIAAERAGGIKRAELIAADKFAPPAKVDAVGGPVALTPAQQRTTANNGVDPAYPTRKASPMAPQPGDSDRAMIYQSEMKAAQGRLTAAKTPEERTRAQSDIDGLGREAGRIGIKLQDESSRKFGEQVASKSADSLLEGRDKAKASADSLIGIEKSRAAIASGIFQGTGAETKLAIAKFFNANIPGVNFDLAKVANTDFAKSSLGAALLAEAKTLGTNPSNADANRINDIVGTVGKDPGAMKMILDWRQEMAERSIKNHNKTVDDAEKRGMSSPYELRVTSPSNTPVATATPTPATPKSFAALPNPAEFNGKRMRAPDGSVIRSNGKTWVKE